MTSPTLKRQSKKIRAYQDVFKTAQGQEVLHDLIKMFYPDTTFDLNQKVQDFNEGKRSVVKYVLKQLRVDVMALENKLKEQEDERSIHLSELYRSANTPS